MTTDTTIPMGDLRRQHARIAAELEAAALRVLQGGWYILGSEVRAFEEEWAHFCGVEHAVGVANGTDALYLALAALGIGSGDEVITVANAGVYQAMAIGQTGASAVFVDTLPTQHTMDPAALERAITPRTRAVIPVHLYGRMADMPALLAVARRHRLAVVEDAAQAHGAWRAVATGGHSGDEGARRRAGAWGTLACFSFYPSKNLGAAGDGGAVVTSDAALAERLRRLRQYGWDEKYHTAEDHGRNSRLDELHAALLRVKLRYLERWNAERRERAAWYADMLAGSGLVLPPHEAGHVYHLYVVEVEHNQRDRLRAHLTAHGIGSDVHYPVPAHRQAVLRGGTPARRGTLPATERLAQRALSLPLSPELTRAEAERVAAAVHAFAAGG